MFGSFLMKLVRLFQRCQRAAALDVGVTPTVASKQPTPLDVGHVQDLIGKVSELTFAVAQDVGNHNVNIQAISAELTAVAQSDPSAVANIVCKLLVANQRLHGRLERAEDTLHDHTQ